MTEAQGVEVIALLSSLSADLVLVRFLVYSLVICVGLGFGAYLWRLVILGKNQRHLW